MAYPITYTVNTAEETSLLIHLKKCNAQFIPPLETRVNIAEYSKKIADYAITFNAWNEKLLVGNISAYLPISQELPAFITNVSVMDDYNKQGIASVLLKMCVEYVQRKKIRAIRLEVFPFNRSAIRLYEKFNFVVSGSNGEVQQMELVLKKT